ncbi:hypothetical protein [Streptomyces avicenniae]|uniref:hypothetical protein n=1 Tax=Streptomyces avicenniae TaxID=500153 RepID=UPI00167F184C|nr:hypothetical protein [Streptomyces avicenniae]
MSTPPPEDQPSDGPEASDETQPSKEVAELAARCAELNAAIAAHLKLLKGM